MYYEAKLLSIFIEDPKRVTEEQLDSYISDARGFMLADYLAEYVISKTSFMDRKIAEWTNSNNNLIKKAGYTLLYIKAKTDKKAEDEFFLPYLETIENEILSAENWVKESMNYAVMYIGSRNKKLNKLCLEMADRIGKITVDYGKTSCQTVDASKWLKSDRIQKIINK